jgi:PadR family transcriptional regulator, regulatory protein PadR
MDELSSLEAVILAAIADGPQYGYELARRVSDLTDDRVRLRPGNLYRILHRLCERGFARELAEAGAAGDERRRYYKATAKGKRAAAEQLSMHARVLQRAPSLKDLLADG